MTEDQYLALCEKYLTGISTPQEEILIREYQDTIGFSNGASPDIDVQNKERLKELLYQKIHISIQQQQLPLVSKINKWHYAAAAVFLIISAAIFLAGNKNTPASTIPISNHQFAKTVIKPGANKAILTLGNGNIITLDDAPNGIISKQGNAAISKSANGIVVKGNNSQLANNALNTISIPRGGKYDITLPDGTRVWLNSSSSLTFPTAFTGTARKVSVTGEAYFEVAKNKDMPFKIDVNGKQVVEVLGTHFNINAYTDEQSITTTLLEGSVKINYKDKSTLIAPGQMAVNSFARSITVKQANMEEIMAWRNGNFIFNNENITSLMRKIARWYDIDVIFKGDMTHINFDGNYSRSKSLESLLKNIELVDNVRFVTEGRRVTVIAK